MYYQNLRNIKKENKINDILNQDLLDEVLNKLDNWLISMNEYKTLRLNPREFGIDKNVNFKIAKKIFLSGYRTNIFDIYFEARTDENEFLELISYEEYLSIVSGKDFSLYSIEKDELIEISSHNIEIWFQLLITPDNFPSSFIKPVESEVAALSGSEISINELEWLRR